MSCPLTPVMAIIDDLITRFELDRVGLKLNRCFEFMVGSVITNTHTTYDYDALVQMDTPKISYSNLHFCPPEEFCESILDLL